MNTNEAAAKKMMSVLNEHHAAMVAVAKGILEEMKMQPVQRIIYALFDQDRICDIYDGFLDVYEMECDMPPSQDVGDAEMNVWIQAASELEGFADVVTRLIDIKENGL